MEATRAVACIFTPVIGTTTPTLVVAERSGGKLQPFLARGYTRRNSRFDIIAKTGLTCFDTSMLAGGHLLPVLSFEHRMQFCFDVMIKLSRRRTRGKKRRIERVGEIKIESYRTLCLLARRTSLAFTVAATTLVNAVSLPATALGFHV